MTTADVATGVHRDNGAPLAQVEGLRKQFVRGGQPLLVLDDVSFDVEPGEFVAIVGPSGCGKTTLLRMLAGMVEPTAGRIVLKSGEMERSRIGFVFQHASLYPWRTVQENVTFGLELAVRRRRQQQSKREVKEEVGGLLSLVGLTGFERYYATEISGGMQQRVNLARALAIKPELLLMDEPFSALDAQTRETLQIELQRIVLAARSTVLFITHDIREAVYLADRVVVLSPRPARILESVRVPTPRPRDFHYQVSDEFNDLLRKIFGLVHHSLSSDDTEET